MKIAYVCLENAEDLLTWSGIPSHMLAAMRRAGHSVSVIGPLNRKFRYLYWPTVLLGNKNLQIDREPLMLASYARQSARALRRIEADVVFAPSSIPVAYLDCKPPIVFWTDAVYDVMIDYYAGFGGSSRVADPAHKQEEAALGRAAHAIYASEWAARAARAHYPKYAHKISVVPFGANIEAVEAGPKRLPDPPYRLLFLGADWVRKGGQIAAEATRLLNESGIPATLHVVGCDPPGSFPYFERHGFLSKATQVGRAKLCDLLASSDFLLLPTRAEAAGIAFCEASAWGLPIISTDTGGVGTYVVNGVNGVTLPLDAGGEQYALAIARIIADRQLYEQLSRGARNEYETRLNWDTAMKSALSLLTSNRGSTAFNSGFGSRPLACD